MSVRGDKGLIDAEIWASMERLIIEAEAELAEITRELVRANAELQLLHEEIARCTARRRSSSPVATNERPA
jgi:phage shock protein A